MFCAIPPQAFNSHICEISAICGKKLRVSLCSCFSVLKHRKINHKARKVGAKATRQGGGICAIPPQAFNSHICEISAICGKKLRVSLCLPLSVLKE